MAKRFTETAKWVDPWFRQLTPNSKLLFLYILDSCNNAGFLEVDEEMILFQTGIPAKDFLGAKQGLIRGIMEIDGWFWVKNFLRHQKNDTLNPTNNAHKQIIALLLDQSARFGEIDEFAEILERENLAPKQPLNRGTGKGNGKGKGKGKEECVNKSVFTHAESDVRKIYAAYPKRVGGSKALAIIDAALNKVDADELLAKVTAYAGSVAGTDPKFIPLPTTWFNQERWLDEVGEASVDWESYAEPDKLKFMKAHLLVARVTDNDTPAEAALKINQYLKNGGKVLWKL